MGDPSADAADKFRSPPRILIPKLVQSRDKWKAKATTRKHQLHKEKIRCRDLSISRQLWKERVSAAQQELLDLRLKLQQVEAERDQAQAQLAQLQDDVAKKN